MPIELADDLVAAFRDKRVTAELVQQLRPMLQDVLRQDMKPLLHEALAEREADVYLGAKEAARYLYGREGAEQAFKDLRRHYAELDQLSVGEGALRRWKRSALDQFFVMQPKLARRLARERQTQKGDAR